MSVNCNYYIGIDPGLDGSIGILDNYGIVNIYDCPTIDRKVRKKHVRGADKGKYFDSVVREFDIEEMANILRKYRNGVATLEKSQAMPGQGSVSMWKTGLGQGLWEGILTGLNIKYDTVRPKEWQKEIHDGTIKDPKEASIDHVKKNFPDADLTPGRCTKSKDGRADAMCIADYTRRKYINGK